MADTILSVSFYLVKIEDEKNWFANCVCFCKICILPKNKLILPEPGIIKVAINQRESVITEVLVVKVFDGTNQRLIVH